MGTAIKVGFLFDQDNDWIQSELGDLKWMPKFSSHFKFIQTFDVGEVSGVDVLFILGYTKILIYPLSYGRLIT